MEYTLTKDNFRQIVLESIEPVLVDFWASWCVPCNMIAPAVEELSHVYKVGKVNVDEEMELAAEYGITSIPALLVFRRGELVRHAVGFRDKDAIAALMEE